MLYCGRKLISYQLEKGIFHCTEEAAHSAAVLSRLEDNAPTIYIMRIQPLEDEFHCACNFKSTLMSADSENLKGAGSLEDFKKNLPALIAKYKVHRILLDDPSLQELFEGPGFTRLMKLLPYIPGPEPNFGIARWEKLPQPEVHPPQFKSVKQPREGTKLSGWLWIGAVLLVVFLLMKAC